MSKEPERRITNAKLPDGRVIRCQDLDFEVESEPWAKYKLQDGTIVKAKIIVGKVSRGIDPATGGVFRNPATGEPFYSVFHNVLIMAEVPESLMEG